MFSAACGMISATYGMISVTYGMISVTCAISVIVAVDFTAYFTGLILQKKV